MIRRGRFSIAAAVLALLAGAATGASAAEVRLPAVERAELGNRLRVMVMPKRDLPLVHLRLVANAGSVADPPGKEGLANLCAALLTQGAAGRGAREFADAIEFVGGEISASAGPEQLVLSCETLSKDFETGLELLRDAATSPTFAPEEFARKHAETLGQIASNRNDPSTIAEDQFDPFLLGDSPLAHPVIGREASVRTITREDVAAFHRRHVTPDNSILVVVGDVDVARASAAVARAFADWKRSGGDPAPRYAAVPQVKGRRVLIVSKPDVTQTQIRIGCIGVARNHPDYFPIMVARTILSVGFASRLTDQLRVNLGLTYTIRSDFPMFRNAGTFRITTFTRNETIKECVEATLAEVRKLVGEGPTAEEIGRARRFMTGQFPLQLQAPAALAAQLANAEFFGLGADYLETYAAKVEAVTAADVRRALKSYFCTEDLRILVVSDPARAQPALSGFGEVTVKPLE